MRSRSDHRRLVALGDRLAEADAIRAKGACRDIDVAVFFPEIPHFGMKGRPDGFDPYAQARRICAGCPVRDACLKFAVDGHEPAGMWGGHSPEERAAIRAQRRQERTG
jgi:WhiB family redox-sensing transcriptional regulator